jgi:Asp-tRNA(Asn)/Glu-tRNA(Gln) amidotransferase A subunit family amidase
VAANVAIVGIGEDTGGSIRGPAAASLVGLRPTLGLVSQDGMLPFRPSYDTAGPIARSAKDAGSCWM